ncbi:MAG: IS1 family transposase [Verrucomicrobia bacterium]|nr:IS1 family transposase [Verrucomicrobiota bacterium]
MNQLDIARRAQILNMLCEGSSLRFVSRLAGVSINTVSKLLVDAGKACAEYHDKHVRNVKSKRVQCDEAWAFVQCKEKNVTAEKKAKGAGDVWTWTALCADTKLMVSWFVGSRDASAAYFFMHDLAERLANCVQLTTDGHRAYLEAVEDAFGSEIDYARLIKLYGAPEGGEVRYSPVECIGAEKVPTMGNPDLKHVSTSFVERSNLTVRMGVRRFTRLTNAFSKKAENHAHAVSLFFMFYNFCRIHKTLRVTPAMKAGITDHVWEVEEIVSLCGT